MRVFFLLLPWLELFTLIQLGVETSALTAILYVLVTFALGIAVLRRQGMGMFERLRESQQGRVIGPDLLLDDMWLGFAGLLLIFPGMISDFVAILMIIGPLRRRLARWLGGPQPEPYVASRDNASHETIEGDFRRLDD